MRNFWMVDGIVKYPQVVACLNNIVILDRRFIPKGMKDLADDLPKPPSRDAKPWLVYDAATEKDFGSWTVYRTRKQAVQDCIQRASRAPRDTVNRYVPDWLRKGMQGKTVWIQGDEVPMTPENIGF